MEDLVCGFKLTEEEMRSLMKNSPLVFKCIAQMNSMSSTIRKLGNECKDVKAKLEVATAGQSGKGVKKRRVDQLMEAQDSQLTLTNKELEVEKSMEGDPDVEFPALPSRASSSPITNKPDKQRDSNRINVQQAEKRIFAANNVRQPPIVILGNVSGLRDLIAKIKTTLGENASFSTKYSKSNTKI